MPIPSLCCVRFLLLKNRVPAVAPPARPTESGSLKCMRPIAADVLDFKTDAIAHQDLHALSGKVRFYSPQLQVYCQAVTKMAGDELRQISANLALLEAGLVIPMPSGGVG